MKLCKLKRLICSILVLALLVTVSAACSNSKEANKSTDKTSSVKADPWVSKPAVTITYAKRTISAMKFKSPDSQENNYWTRLLASKGINLKMQWAVDASQYEDRVNVAITAGEIPDILFFLTAGQAIKLEKSDMLMDMKPYLDKYLSPLSKSILYSKDAAAMFNFTVTKDEKQYLLPQITDNLRDQVECLWIRKDWLQNVNMKFPKTWDEFMKVCDAFVNKDPDRNGKKDTYALGIGGKDNLVKDWSSLSGFFNAFNAQPVVSFYDNSLFYEKDASGKIIWSGSKPGVKKALTVLQDMYKKHYLSADFGSADSGGKLTEDLVASKCGIFEGPYWCASWPLGDLKTKIPTSDWEVGPYPSGDGTPYKITCFNTAPQFTVVSKNCKHPEAAVQALNWWLERAYGTSSEDIKYLNSDPNDGSMNKYNNPMYNFDDVMRIQKNYNAVTAALASKDPSKLIPIQKKAYDDVLAYQKNPKDPIAWINWQANSGADGTIGKYNYGDLKDSDLLPNAFFSLLTDTMIAKLPSYKKMAEETITKIIYGQAPVSDWDKMVASWNKLGGDAILKEVQNLAK